MKRIPVITLWQPWATWIMWGWKTTETRLHPGLESLAHRTIGIHAAKHWDKDALRLAEEFLSVEQKKSWAVGGQVIPYGVLLGTVFAITHHPLIYTDSPDALIDCSIANKRYGLVLRDVHPFAEPIPMKGKQGIWYAEVETP